MFLAVPWGMSPREGCSISPALPLWSISECSLKSPALLCSALLWSALLCDALLCGALRRLQVAHAFEVGDAAQRQPLVIGAVAQPGGECAPRALEAARLQVRTEGCEEDGRVCPERLPRVEEGATCI